MFTGNDLTAAQTQAVYREHNQAVQDGNVELAYRIRVANPDLFNKVDLMRVPLEPK